MKPSEAHFLARAIMVLVAWLVTASISHAATINIINGDTAGEGFNDATAFTPVGNNPATTLGQARLNAFQYAANLLGAALTSTVAIDVNAKMDPLGGDGTSATLASAGPAMLAKNFPGAPVANTWYVMALAEKISGVDASVTEINATFNSDVDNGTVLGTTNWYYGYDGNAGGHVDLVSVVLHELTHGLGFLTGVNLATGAKPAGYNDAYMRHLEHHGVTPSDYPGMSDAQRVTASTATGSLHWTGASVTAQIGTLTAGVSGGHVQMYAPNPSQLGASVSHFDKALTPNQLMEPFYVGPNHRLGMARYLFQDIGWGAVPEIVEVTPSPGGPSDYGSFPAGDIVVSTNPDLARPFGVELLPALERTGMLRVGLGFAAFAAPVDIYVVVALPDGQTLTRAASGAWAPYTGLATVSPLRAHSGEALSLTSNSNALWYGPADALPRGTYLATVAVVPAGTPPSGFNPASSSYYLWRFSYTW